MVFSLQKHQSMETLAQNTLDTIPAPNADAKKITALVKQNGKVVGYRLSDHTIVPKEDAIELTRQGGIVGVGIAHNGDTEYLKSIPDGTENNNLSHLPTVSSTEIEK